MSEALNLPFSVFYSDILNRFEFEYLKLTGRVPALFHKMIQKAEQENEFAEHFAYWLSGKGCTVFLRDHLLPMVFKEKERTETITKKCACCGCEHTTKITHIPTVFKNFDWERYDTAMMHARDYIEGRY